MMSGDRMYVEGLIDLHGFGRDTANVQTSPTERTAFLDTCGLALSAR